MASAMVEDEAGKGGQVVPHRGARGAARSGAARSGWRAQDLKLLPSLSPLDLVDLGLVEPEPATGEDARTRPTFWATRAAAACSCAAAALRAGRVRAGLL
jgi:hypothetical protein